MTKLGSAFERRPRQVPEHSYYVHGFQAALSSVWEDFSMPDNKQPPEISAQDILSPGVLLPFTYMNAGPLQFDLHLERRPSHSRSNSLKLYSPKLSRMAPEHFWLSNETGPTSSFPFQCTGGCSYNSCVAEADCKCARCLFYTKSLLIGNIGSKQGSCITIPSSRRVKNYGTQAHVHR